MGTYAGSTGWVDFAALDRDIEVASPGTEVARRVTELLCLVTRTPSVWQYVLHGESRAYRQMVTEVLCDGGRYKAAKRYATCGLGDTCAQRADGSEVKVRSRLCMSRACPRCSRIGGQRIYKRVVRVLGGRRHGAIGHVVVTQQALEGESLADAKSRYEAKWRRLERMRGEPEFVGGLASFHLKMGSGSHWHYHAHLMVECQTQEGLESWMRRFVDRWRAMVEEECGVSEDMHLGVMCGPGSVMDFGKDSAQGDFFEESSNVIVRALQYGLRDVVQGVERWVTGELGEHMVAEFLIALGGAKLHRLYGNWRHKAEKVEEEPGEKAAVVEKAQWISCGSVSAVVADALAGVEFAVSLLRTLLTMYSGKTDVYRRLSSFLRGFG